MRLYLMICCTGLLGLLSGCGGNDATPPPPKKLPADLLFIGNSLTRRQPLASIGWLGDHGMAASSAEKDYAHLVSSAMKLPMQAFTYATLEREYDESAIPQYKALAGPDTAVVVQLGDNVSDMQKFMPSYVRLLDAVKDGNRLLCIGSWWSPREKDALMKTACEKHGGLFIPIGDIFQDPTNPDLLEKFWENKSVNVHPHDWGMARIAERVAAAMTAQ